MKQGIRKYRLILLLFLLGGYGAKGQIYPETAFYWANPYYISPASVNLDYRAFFHWQHASNGWA